MKKLYRPAGILIASLALPFATHAATGDDTPADREGAPVKAEAATVKAEVSPTRNAPMRESAHDYSWIPMTTEGYVTGNIGQSSFDTNCTGPYACDDTGIGFKVTAGGMYRKGIGFEVSFLNLGKAEASGGSMRAQGLDFSVVGNLPINDVLSAFAKVGVTYGWTKVTAATPGTATGDDRGFGISYGVGVAFNVSRRWDVIGEWDHYRFDFAGPDNDVNLLSAGLRYKF